MADSERNRVDEAWEELLGVVADYAQVNSWFNLNGGSDSLPRILSVREALAELRFKGIGRARKKRQREGRPVPLEGRVERVRAEQRIRAQSIALRAQIEHLKIFDEMGPGDVAAKYEWPMDSSEQRGAARTVHKTVGEVLSPFYARRHPKRSDAERDGGRFFDIMEIDHTRSIRICELLDIPQGGKNGIERLSSRIEMDGLLRSRLKQIIPVQRVSIDKGTREDFRIFGVIPAKWEDGTQASNAGMLIGTQSNNGREVFFSTDLQKGYRRVIHIKSGYEREVEVLRGVLDVVESAHADLSDWSRIKSEGKHLKLQSQLAAQVDTLAHVKDPVKRDLKDQIAHALSLRKIRGDGSGRYQYNPGATRANLVSAKRYLAERFRAIQDKAAYMTKDELALKKRVDKQRPLLEEFVSNVESINDRFLLVNLDRHLPEDSIDSILGRLGELESKLDDLNMEPYMSFAKKFLERLKNLRKVLQELRTKRLPVDILKYRRMAAEEYIKLYSIAKINRLNNDLTDMYYDISVKSDDTHPVDVLADLKDARTRFKEITVARSRVLMLDYSPQFREIYDFVDGLIGCVARELDVDPEQPLVGEVPKVLSDAKRAQLYKSLKEAVADFSFRDRVLAHLDGESAQRQLFSPGSVSA